MQKSHSIWVEMITHSHVEIVCTHVKSVLLLLFSYCINISLHVSTHFHPLCESEGVSPVYQQLTVSLPSSGRLAPMHALSIASLVRITWIRYLGKSPHAAVNRQMGVPHPPPICAYACTYTRTHTQTYTHTHTPASLLPCQI